MLTTFLTAIAILVLMFVMMSVKVVRQGYQYTIEYFGRFTPSRSRASTSSRPSSIASAAR